MIPAVLSTRPAGADDPLVAALEATGLRCLAVPTVATVPAATADELAAAVAGLPDGGWIAVTSGRGAQAVLAALAGSGRDPGTVRWAAVAEATAQTLRDHGIADVVVGPGTGAGLAGAIDSGNDLDGVRVLLPRADAAGGDLPARLRDRGAEVVDLVAYRTIEGPEANRGALRAALADPGLAAVVFASGSAVRGLLALGGPATAEALDRTALVSIGPATSGAMRDQGLRVAAQATGSSVSQLVAAVRSVVPVPPARRPLP